MTCMYKCIQCVCIFKSGLDVPLSAIETLSNVMVLLRFCQYSKLRYLIGWKGEMDGTFAL